MDGLGWNQTGNVRWEEPVSVSTTIPQLDRSLTSESQVKYITEPRSLQSTPINPPSLSGAGQNTGELLDTMPTFPDLVTDILGNATALAVAALVTCYLLLYRWQLVKTHPDEPPIIPSALPFIGHPLRMALQGGRHVKNLG
jgi:hypothetical protein